jgi:hypothetical protein
MNDVGGGAGAGAGAGGAMYEPYDGGYGIAAGAAGIGAAAGAVAMQRARSRRETAGFNTGGGVGVGGELPGVYEDRTPYPAFAGPGLQPHEAYDQSGVPGLRYRRGGPGSGGHDALFN